MVLAYAAGQVLGAWRPQLAGPYVVRGAGVAVVLAGTYLLWHSDLAWTLSAAVGFSIFTGNWERIAPALPIPPDRALLALAVVMVLVKAPGARCRPDLRLGLPHALLALLVLYAIGSAYAADMLGDPEARFRLLDRLGIVPFAAFVLAPRALGTERQRKIFLVTLVAVGGYLALTALFSAVGLNALVWPRYILDAEAGIHFGRARGPFLEGTTNGFALFACGVAAVIAATRWRDPGARMVAWLVTAGCTVGIVLTLQRSVWIGAAVGTVVALAAAPRLRRYLLPAAAAGAIAVVLSLAVIPGLSERAGERAAFQLSVWDRENLNEAAFRMVEARPLLGFGWNGFLANSSDYLWLSDARPLTAGDQILHSALLTNAVELGLLGMALWLAVVLATIVPALVRRGPPELGAWRAGLIAVSSLWLVLAALTPLVQLFPNLLLWTWAGVVWAGLQCEPSRLEIHAYQLEVPPRELPA